VPVPRELAGITNGFVQIDISAVSADHPSWREPIRTHFRRTSAGWKLVGLQRLPATLPNSGAGTTK
jgi:hypothetical protein